MYHHAHALSRSLSPLAPFEHMQATGGGAAQYLKALPAGGWGKSLGGVGLWWGSGGGVVGDAGPSLPSVACRVASHINRSFSLKG